MTLKEMLERECRFYGAINFDKTVDDDVAIYINRNMLHCYQNEITSTHGGLYIGNTRVLIDHRLDNNIVQISLV